ncbi:MAG: hypothetical protein ACXQTO_01580 [Candidatus Syntropharchaeales archaeon]
MKKHRFIQSFCLIDDGKIYFEDRNDGDLDLDLLVLLWQVLVVHSTINAILIKANDCQVYAQKVKEGSTAIIFASNAASLALIHSTYQKIVSSLMEEKTLLDGMRKDDLESVLSDSKEPEGLNLDTNKEVVMTIEEIKRFKEEWKMEKSPESIGGIRE